MKTFGLLCLACVVSACGGPGSRTVSFREQIQPIFAAHCSACHGTEKPRGQIVLASYESLMASRSVSGRAPLVSPGSPNESLLYILCATN